MKELTNAEKHLESLDAAKFEEWVKYNSFDIFAQHIGENGNVILGVTGTQKYAVKIIKAGSEPEFHPFDKPGEAIDFYKELFVPLKK